MVLVSYSGKEINAKLVYYGPGLSGKTTNLEQIYGSIPQTHRGKMVSMKTKTERTLFFDFLPVNLGELAGFKTRFLLYTVPGQVYYNATRKLVLKGVDAVVFVADSKRGKMDENVESLDNLKENLRENGLTLDTLPWVIQYNKRDLPDAYSLDELQQVLNPQNVPFYEAVATNGQGVVETFKAVSKLLLRKLSKEVGAPILSNKAAAHPVEEASAANAPPRGAAPPLTPEMAPPPTMSFGSASSAAAAAFASSAPSAPAPQPAPVAPSAPTSATAGHGLSLVPPAAAVQPAPKPAAPPMFETYGAPGVSASSTQGAPPRDIGLSRSADSFEIGGAEAPRVDTPKPAISGDDGALSVGDRLRRWLGRKDATSEQEPSGASPNVAQPSFQQPTTPPPSTPPSSPTPPQADVPDAAAASAPWLISEDRSPHPALAGPTAERSAPPAERAPQPSPFSTGSPIPESPAAPAGTPSFSRSFELDAGMPSEMESPTPAKPEPRRFEIERDPMPHTTPMPPAASHASPIPASVAIPEASAEVSPTNVSPSANGAQSEPRTIVVPVELSSADLSAGVVLKLELKLADHGGQSSIGERAA